MAKVPPTSVRPSFYIRTQLSDAPTYRYERASLRGWDCFEIPHPPAVGDLVHLPAGLFRVIARDWMYPEYGSGSWPLGEPHANEGPLMQIIVEPAEGLFADAQITDDDDD